MARISQW